MRDAPTTSQGEHAQMTTGSSQPASEQPPAPKGPDIFTVEATCRCRRRPISPEAATPTKAEQPVRPDDAGRRGPQRTAESMTASPAAGRAESALHGLVRGTIHVSGTRLWSRLHAGLLRLRRRQADAGPRLGTTRRVVG